MFHNVFKISTRSVLFLYDFSLFVCSILIFLVYFRGGGALKDPYQIWGHAMLAFCCIFLARLFGQVYRQIWRFGGVQCYIRFIIVDGIGCLAYILLNLKLPITTIAISRIISVCSLNLLAGLFIRMVYRYCYKCGNDDTRFGRFLNLLLKTFAGDYIINYRQQSTRKRRIAIIGAGRVGVSLAESLLNNSEARYEPACFIDADEDKAGRDIRGIRVFSSQQVSGENLRALGIEDVVLAVPNLELDRKRTLYEFYCDQGMNVKVYDYPLMGSNTDKLQLRNFEVEEVLFRAPIVVTNENTKAYYRDKVILVTGGGGSIGSELARQVARMAPRQLILLDIYENGVYDLQQELKMHYGKDLDVRVEICSITNRSALEKVFAAYYPHIVINAAAHKHVPLMEHNCTEAVTNNVFGTLNVVQLCEKYCVQRFMTLSTDKAVNPTNVMGATKRMCEFIIQAYSTSGAVKYSATRFGNVLGSAGSVIPLFKKQIAHGGPITLTDKRIIRYFMTIPEASQLVLESGAIAKNGELFVLDMGQPVKILDLAENMIRLSGLEPGKDIEIIETGLRPGEKLYEELLVRTEELDKTDNDLICIERDTPITMDQLEDKLSILQTACTTGDDDKVREALRTVVPTFHRPEEVNGASVLFLHQNPGKM